jgi:hypothetical protein
MQYIEDYYQTTDPVDDWSPAIERAQANWRATNDTDDVRGFTLLFRPRTYRFSRTIELIRGMSLIGAGGLALSGTVLEFPDGVTGIVCHRPATTPQPLAPGRGDGSIVERMQINARGNSNPSAHGVVMYAAVSLRDVSIFRFGGNGIHIEAGSVIPGTNADAWQIYNCRVQQSSGDGLFLRGDDANAGCAIGLLCNDNGGWAIQDISAIGNTFIACLAHENGPRTGAVPGQPPYPWGFRCTAETNLAGAAVSAYPRGLFLNC